MRSNKWCDWYDPRDKPHFDHWSSSDGHPQPRIYCSREPFVEATLELPPPHIVATNESIPWAAVVKIPSRPKPCWLVTECRMIACDPHNPANKDTNIPLATLSGGWRGGDTSTLFFFFENVTFPIAGRFRVKFEIVMKGYEGERPETLEEDTFPDQDHYWSQEDWSKLPPTLKGKKEEYEKTGFRAGVSVAKRDITVSDDPKCKGMHDPAKNPNLPRDRTDLLAEWEKLKETKCIKVRNNKFEPETPLPT